MKAPTFPSWKSPYKWGQQCRRSVLPHPAGRPSSAKPPIKSLCMPINPLPVMQQGDTACGPLGGRGCSPSLIGPLEPLDVDPDYDKSWLVTPPPSKPALHHSS